MRSVPFSLLRPTLLTLFLLVLTPLAGPGVAASPLPELRLEAPPAFAGIAARLETIDPQSFRPTLDLLGLAEAGPPIRVVLAPEGSPEASRVPAWAVGYAIGDVGLVVLLPERVPAYPDSDLKAVLRHEVAHVLVARAAHRVAVPRWLNEGLAMVAGREWGLEDRSRLLLATVRGEVSLAEIDTLFHRDPVSVARAYALSGAFVRYLLGEAGPRAPARILRRLREGTDLEDAFRTETGLGLAETEAAFTRHLDWWNKWLPLLSSSTIAWATIALLALWAFKRRRERDAEQREAWHEEERRELAHLPTDGWIH